MPTGLKTSLNKLREVSSDIYFKYIPEIDEDTDISRLATPIFEVPEVYNEFCNALINRIVYTQFIAKTFRNPFVVLDGDALPLGYAGQEVYTNPTKGRQYNPEDFAGLLQKYDADVKVQYQAINSDLQYPVTFSRQQLKKAFVSWGDLEAFIDGLSNSLYNGCYIDEYNKVKEDSHAWFTGFAPAEDPEISVTIIVERIGSGGDYAVPIAKRLFDAYFEVN